MNRSLRRINGLEIIPSNPSNGLFTRPMVSTAVLMAKMSSSVGTVLVRGSILYTN
jgi:hypothetical protein